MNARSPSYSAVQYDTWLFLPCVKGAEAIRLATFKYASPSAACRGKSAPSCVGSSCVLSWKRCCIAIFAERKS